MLHINIPSTEEINRLSAIRSDACVSIFVQTSPLREQLKASQIQLGNLTRSAVDALHEKGIAKKTVKEVEERLQELLENESFWRLHANTLAIFATPEKVYTYRLPNEIKSSFEVSDRFYVKPLFRPLTLSYSADILLLSENRVRYLEFFENSEIVEVDMPDVPKNFSSFINADEGINHSDKDKTKVKQHQYVQEIIDALRPHFYHHNQPLLLVAAEPLASMFRNQCTISNFIEPIIFKNADDTNINDLKKDIIAAIQALHQKQIDEIRAHLASRKSQNRFLMDITDIAHASTHGNIETLMVNMDAKIAGVIAEDGTVQFDATSGQYTLDILDEITKRAASAGAKIYAVRKEDLPAGADVLAASVRYVAY